MRALRRAGSEPRQLVHAAGGAGGRQTRGRGRRISSARGQLAAAVSQLAMARAQQESAERQVRACEQRLREADDQLNQCLGEVRAAQGQVSALVNERDQILVELRGGFYCSQCNRSKTEIERETGMSFYSHLTQVNGHPVPAPESLIQQKTEEYAQKIAAAEEKVREQRARCAPCQEQINRAQAQLSAAHSLVGRLQSEISAAEERVRQQRGRVASAFGSWRAAVTDESMVRRNELDWDDLERRAALQEKLATVNEMQGLFSAGIINDKQLFAIRQSYALGKKAYEEWKAERSRRDHEYEDQAKREADADREAARTLEVALPGGEWSWPTPATLSLGMLGAKLSTDGHSFSVEAGPAKLKVTANSMDIEVGLKKLFNASFHFEDNPVLLQQTLRVGLEHKYGGVHMDRVLTFGSDGVHVNENPSFEIFKHEIRGDDHPGPAELPGLPQARRSSSCRSFSRR